MEINELLKTIVEKNASDLHLSVGEPPIIRVDGDLVRLEGEKFSNDTLKTMLEPVMSGKVAEEYKDRWEVDFSYEVEGVARFRVNVYKTHKGISAAFRSIPYEVPKFDSMGLNDIFKKFCLYPNGLIIITGPTGSGKSTTLAAMIDYLNCDSGLSKHIITIEDPVEFVYTNKNCLIDQREVGQDTQSFNNALRSALREDPDILLVGEMRDLETIRLALTAAETGHLVFATLHTNSAPKTIDRIVDVFPAGEGGMVRTMLAESLRVVAAQTLLKRPEGGRIIAQELLIANPAVKNLIREQKVAQLFSVMQTSKEVGMHTLEQHIKDLVEAKKAIPPDVV